MIDDIKTSIEPYDSFIKDSIKQLKSTRVCYVFTKQQLEEIKKRVNEKLRIEENPCGYTIRIERR